MGEAIWVGGDAEVTRLFPARGLSRFCFQRGVQLNAVLHEPREAFGRTKLPNLCRRVPRGAARQFGPLQQDDVAAAVFSEVVGGAASHDAAADDHDLSVFRRGLVHC